MTDELTPREAEIAELLREGLLQREIAALLGISVRTVEVHVGRIRLKRRAPTTTAAIANPRRRRYVEARRGNPQVDVEG